MGDGGFGMLGGVEEKGIAGDRVVWEGLCS